MAERNTQATVSNPSPASKVDRYTADAVRKLTIGITNDGQPYAFVAHNKNWIAFPLRSRRCKAWLRREARQNNEYLREDDLKDIIENLYAHSAVDGSRLMIRLRVGVDENGDVELDLGTEDLARVKFKSGVATISTEGSKTLFNRPDSMLPLPTPAAQGDWKQLLPFLNMSEDDQYLLLSWMCFVLTHPPGTSAYPIAIVKGPQGTGKSILFRHVLRALLDPNAAGIQLFPASGKDLAISALSQYMLLYDNVRTLTKPWSDIFCVTSTGGSMGTRALYTDDQECLLHVHTPVALNTVHNVVQEPDLASRCFTIKQRPLPDDARREESALTRDLISKHPVIFRGLLDLCAQTLEAERDAKVLYPARLMNFSRWLAAMEQVLGMPAGRLQLAYVDNLRDAALETVRENTLAVTLLNFVSRAPEKRWAGTATQLLEALSQIAPQQIVHRQAEWPQSPISLSKRLNQLSPLLESQGIVIGFSHGTQRQVEITYCPPETGKTIDEIEEPDESVDDHAQPTGLADCSPIQDQGGIE
jgi:hypothetical protein